MRSFSATSKVSLTFSLLMEIEFPANSRFASPFDFKNPDFSEIKSITLLPTTSVFEISICGTPSKTSRKVFSFKFTKSSAVERPNKISEAFTAFSNSS